MITPRYEGEPIIKQSFVYEWVQLDRQPIDGQVHQTVAKIVFKVNWQRNRVERHRDAWRATCNCRLKVQRIERAHGVWNANAKVAFRLTRIEAAGLRQAGAQIFQSPVDSWIHLLSHGCRRQTLWRPDEQFVFAYLSQPGQRVAGSGLAEREAIGGSTDAADLVDRLKDRQQVEIKAAQVEHWGCFLGRPDRSLPAYGGI